MKWLVAFCLVPPLAAKPEPKVTYSVEQASVQEVAKALAERAGYAYHWQKSHDGTDPQCREWVRNLRLKGVPFSKAMRQVLGPIGLRYEIEGAAVVLYRDPLIDYSSGRKSVQDIAKDLAARAGLEYDWEKSFAQTNPECRVFESVSVKRKTFEEAMEKALKPVRLRYRVESGKVVLYPR